ncbi:MAG TPA: hypothetical protein VJB87_01645 [Candidatus Nanoarchaeia archaeon]|nr:hypothetical protein [Candidatus Nanoarchaeia archaeon]
MKKVLILILLLFLVIGCGTPTPSVQQNTQGKSLEELSALNKPVFCTSTTFPTLAEQREQYPNERIIVIKGYHILGNKILFDASLWTNDEEKLVGYIYDGDKGVIYRPLSVEGKESLKNWWSETRTKDESLMDLTYPDIKTSIEELDCNAGTFGKEIFSPPEKLCYWTEDDSKEPNCANIF